LVVRELTFEERYKLLLDEITLLWLANYSFNKKQGTLDRWLEYYISVQKQMLRRYFSVAKFLNKVTPGRTFRNITERIVYALQRYFPLEHIKLSFVSDHEAVLEIRNCPLYKRYKKLISKANLDLDPKFVCDTDLKIYPIIAREFGIDLTYELQENGCRLVGKLK